MDETPKPDAKPRDPARRCAREGCKAYPRKGSRFCHQHGGAVPKGIAVHSFKTGYSSAHMPTGLKVDYQRALDDPDLLSLRHDVALLHARVQGLIKRLHTGESGQLWSDLKDVYIEIRSAHRQKDHDGMERWLNRMGELVNAGIQDELVWNALIETIEKKSQLSAREWRRMVDLHQIMTVEEAMALITQVALSVRENVKDPVALRAISDTISRLCNYKPPGHERQPFTIQTVDGEVIEPGEPQP